MAKSNEFQIKMVEKTLLRKAKYEIQGYINELQDEMMTVEEFKERINQDYSRRVQRSYLNDSYKEGIFFYKNNEGFEAKHIKFIGNVVLDEIIERNAKRTQKLIDETIIEFS